MNWRQNFLLLAISIATAATACGAISSGVLSDFQDGTTMGWSGGASPMNITNGGPTGAGDHFLQIGNGGNFATFNSGPDFSGTLDPSVTSIQVDLMRPSIDAGSLDIRLVLFGPGTTNAWTSSAAKTIPNDGVWRSYTFSTAETDLTQVRGSDTYGNLAQSVNRIMFRHNPGAPADTGFSIPGTLGIDNVAAIPEPSLATLLAVPVLVFSIRRRR